MLGRPSLQESVVANVFFDTCVYHQPGVNLLFEVVGVDNILFGSEMIGAVRGLDPQTAQHFDDMRRYVDALGLAPGAGAKVYELNARGYTRASTRFYEQRKAPRRWTAALAPGAALNDQRSRCGRKCRRKIEMVPRADPRFRTSS